MEIFIISLVWYFFTFFVRIKQQKYENLGKSFTIKSIIVIYGTYMVLVLNACFLILQAITGSLILHFNVKNTTVGEIYRDSLIYRILIMFSDGFMFLYLFKRQG